MPPREKSLLEGMPPAYIVSWKRCPPNFIYRAEKKNFQYMQGKVKFPFNLGVSYIKDELQYPSIYIIAKTVEPPVQIYSGPVLD